MLRIGFKHCPYCHRHDIRNSRPKSLWEDLIVLALLRPVRCHDCMHRFYLPLFVSTTDVPLVSARRITPRPVPAPERKSASPTAKRPAISEPAERRSA